MHVGTFHPLQSDMQDRPNTKCIASVLQGGKDWKAKVLVDFNNLTAQQNEEVLQLLEDFKDVFSQLPIDYAKTVLNGMELTQK